MKSQQISASDGQTLDAPLSRAALHYATTQLAMRIDKSTMVSTGPSQSRLTIADVPLIYAHPEKAQLDRVQTEGAAIIIAPAAATSWAKLIRLPTDCLEWVTYSQCFPAGTASLKEERLPVLFWGEGYKAQHNPFVEQRKDGSIIFYSDIIVATFFMLTRWEEMISGERDMHGRFPATSSVAYKQKFLHRPIVDEYALILRAWLKRLKPNWQPQVRQFDIRVSHDVDHVQRFNSPRSGIRPLAKAILTDRQMSESRVILQDMTAAWAKRGKDSLYKSISQLATLSEGYGFSSSFNFMAATPSTYDSGYDPAAPNVRKLIKSLMDRGHEIGFHPSYKTWQDSALFQKELTRLNSTIERKVRGGRQHYLRVALPETLRLWEQAELDYDSSIGYAMHEGFRCGTCHPYRPFDIEFDREMKITEIPLIVMDGTLRTYRQLSPKKSEERMLDLARRCYQVGGTFTILWHNSSLNGTWQPWYQAYKNVLRTVATEMCPHGANGATQ